MWSQGNPFTSRKSRISNLIGFRVLFSDKPSVSWSAPHAGVRFPIESQTNDKFTPISNRKRFDNLDMQIDVDVHPLCINSAWAGC